MNNIYKNIQKIREEQEEEAGPFFAELSTPETWLEIMRWLVNEESEDFEAQMSEVAAMAIWAVQASQESAQLGVVLDSVFGNTDAPVTSEPKGPGQADQFGPMDYPMGRTRNRKNF